MQDIIGLDKTDCRPAGLVFAGKAVTMAAARTIMGKVEWRFANHEFPVSSRAVLELVASPACSAYDCEFVALAEEQRVPLITADRQILQDFPAVAISLERFVLE